MDDELNEQLLEYSREKLKRLQRLEEDQFLFEVFLSRKDEEFIIPQTPKNGREQFKELEIDMNIRNTKISPSNKKQECNINLGFKKEINKNREGQVLKNVKKRLELNTNISNVSRKMAKYRNFKRNFRKRLNKDQKTILGEEQKRKLDKEKRKLKSKFKNYQSLYLDNQNQNHEPNVKEKIIKNGCTKPDNEQSKKNIKQKSAGIKKKTIIQDSQIFTQDKTTNSKRVTNNYNETNKIENKWNMSESQIKDNTCNTDIAKTVTQQTELDNNNTCDVSVTQKANETKIIVNDNSQINHMKINQNKFKGINKNNQDKYETEGEVENYKLKEQRQREDDIFLDSRSYEELLDVPMQPTDELDILSFKSYRASSPNINHSVQPLDMIVDIVCKMPKYIIISHMGAVNTELSMRVPQTVWSFNSVHGAGAGVMECDLAHTPLPPAAVHVTVYCQALTNEITPRLVEANRVLMLGGQLLIVEEGSRFDHVNVFIWGVERLGFRLLILDRQTSNIFFLLHFVKIISSPTEGLPALKFKSKTNA